MFARPLEVIHQLVGLYHVLGEKSEKSAPGVSSHNTADTELNPHVLPLEEQKSHP